MVLMNLTWLLHNLLLHNDPGPHNFIWVIWHQISKKFGELVELTFCLQGAMCYVEQELIVHTARALTHIEK